jgi:predicted nuclease of predicted toxin-antitoxin system
MIRFYLDEDLSYRIAEIARARGIDIITSRESGFNGRPDDEQLLFAARQGRCFVTENFGDFVQLTHEFQAAGHPHAGVALVPAFYNVRR